MPKTGRHLPQRIGYTLVKKGGQEFAARMLMWERLSNGSIIAVLKVQARKGRQGRRVGRTR
jgi:hypothetical protein